MLMMMKSVDLIRSEKNIPYN